VRDLICSEDFTIENAKEIFSKEIEKSQAMRRVLESRHNDLLNEQASLKRLLKTRNWQIAQLKNSLDKFRGN
jgi:hypothetical protein